MAPYRLNLEKIYKEINLLEQEGLIVTKLYIGEVEVINFAHSMYYDLLKSDRIPSMTVNEILEKIKKQWLHLNSGPSSINVVYWPRESMFKFGVKRSK